MKKIFLLLVLHFFFIYAFSQKKIVVLGSSTAAGTGASVYDSSWVARLQSEYRKNITAGDLDTVVTNLAVGGFVSYQIMPSSYSPPAGKPAPDVEHNVTKALGFSPDIIIINLPTNDVGSGYSETEFMTNLRFLNQHIASAGVKAYITTTQPRSQYDFAMRRVLRNLVDSITNTFGINAINFWDDLATNDGQFNLRPEVNSGDGVHVNNLGHRLLFERVKAKNLFNNIVTAIAGVGSNTDLFISRFYKSNSNISAEIFTNRNRLVTVTIFETSGRMIFQKQHSLRSPSTELKVPVSTLPAGLYYFMVNTGTQYEVIKFSTIR